MKKLLFFFFTLLIAACNHSSTGSEAKVVQDLIMEEPTPPKLPGIAEQSKTKEQRTTNKASSGAQHQR
jgi:uncharacterized protein YcfL